MHISSLAVGLVCYWQDGGWHGCEQVVKFNKRFVYYVDYPNPKKQIQFHRKKGLRKFLESHRIYNCEYGSYHKNIGKIVPIV